MNKLKNLTRFFPFQLFINYFKRDYIFLISWTVIFMLITGGLASSFGLQYIFLSPEYLDHINIWAFMFTGIGIGVFVMAYNISAYVITAHRYPFIATVSRPFLIFFINNSIFPLIYLIVYIYESLHNQIYYEEIKIYDAVVNIVFLIVGIVAFISFTFLLFYVIIKFLPHQVNKLKSKFISIKWVNKMLKKQEELKLEKAPKSNEGKDKTAFYIGRDLKIKLSREFSHYSKEFLSKIFRRQHINALIFVFIMLLAIIIRGFFTDKPALILPASASLHIAFAVILLLITIFYVFFTEWTLLAVVVTLIAVNYINPFFSELKTHTAFGMNYKQKNEKINPYAHGSYTADSSKIISILDKWANNYKQNHNGQKPPFIVVTSNGGGMKLSYWTFYTLTYADSITQGELLNNTRLMTGASGGMLGLAYFRELYRQKITGEIDDLYDKKYPDDLSKDLLNPLLYGLSMSDWLPYYLQTKIYGHRYPKTRAFLFEQAFNRNTDSILNKPLIFYKKYEENAQIPMLILTPSIVSIGSRMMISPLGISFLTKDNDKEIANVEFRQCYKNFSPDSLNFLSAIRMNASFPYVTPFVTLPGKPRIRVFDAGLNDNYGFLTAFDFLVYFNDWINKNTSSVIFLEISENHNIKYDDKTAAVDKLFEPLLSLFRDWDKIQKLNYFDVIKKLNKIYYGKFYLISFHFSEKKHKVSLSWHLTKKEKKFLKTQIFSQENKTKFETLKSLITK